MELRRNGTQASARGPAEYFTGSVRVDPLFVSVAPARVSAAVVTFEPGARSNWHTHPLGQRLVVTNGCGYVQSWGEPLRVIRPGDVVVCPPGEKHWHGAAPGTSMSHIAIQEELNGKVVDWLEPVTDEQYRCAAVNE
jgi:quercetin dioxygenase-like cupin family protein